jgi:hypothetical protein
MVGVARSIFLPPPIKGWSTKRAIADMKPDYAVRLTNGFPETNKITLRPGHTVHATGLGASVESLIDYTPRSGTGVLFGAAGSNIYNVTGSGAVGAAVVASRTNARFQHVNIGTSGGQFLFICNGADTPKTYDGSSWADTTLTGPTTANLIWCNTHQRRLWVGEVNSLSAWYGAANAITGAFTEFPLYGVFKLGGYLMGLVTWTRDGGAGSDDVACFVTSEGEVAVYSGTDPSSASTWELVGVFRIGRPVGRRFFTKFGSDAILITQSGFVPLSAILPIDLAQRQAVAISDEIDSEVSAAVRSYGTNYGWQPFIYPKRNMAIFNAPITSTTAQQFVFNTLSKAACPFAGINAICWGLIGETAYFGASDGKTYKFDSGLSDNGTAIATDWLQGYYDFRSPGLRKAFKMVDPIFSANGEANAALDICTDYKIVGDSTVGSPVVTGDLWGTMLWGTGKWAADDAIFRGWRGVRGIGRAGALRIRTSSTTLSLAWEGTQFLFVPGAPIG